MKRVLGFHRSFSNPTHSGCEGCPSGAFTSLPIIKILRLAKDTEILTRNVETCSRVPFPAKLKVALLTRHAHHMSATYVLSLEHVYCGVTLSAFRTSFLASNTHTQTRSGGFCLVYPL